ncbi:MAG: phytanoyl-CoA dioxygenase family protein [Sphingomonadaceae bacterium]|nr:phytanoyl-CoA dioxygenase family protein [Sphingomonadaceae bacterium]
MATQAVTDERPATPDFPVVHELKTHNHLIGDLAALDEAWRRDGYWFFRDVLDTDAVGKLRAEYVAELERQGVTDPVGDAPTDRSVCYNGASLADYPFRMEPLADRQLWKLLAAQKPINDFFQRLFEDEPFWVPIAEYRATPPSREPAQPRIDGIHQDGPYSPGLPFRICWIPLAEIDENVGGLILAEGLTEEINRHPKLANGSNTSIPLDAIPADAWRRATYRAGDVLLMNLWTPHTGLSNISDRFRLSLDTRIMARGDDCPIVGEVVSIATDRVEVKDDRGVQALRIEPATYVRNTRGQKLSGTEITDFFTPGSDVIIARTGDLATVVRPPH